jgi:predicted RNase H-like HicB family nuclease
MTDYRYIPIKGAGMTTYVFKVVITPDGNDRYYAEVPVLPGCYSWGYTFEEALKNIKEATQLWIENMIENGEPIPEEAPETLRKAPVTLGVVV